MTIPKICQISQSTRWDYNSELNNLVCQSSWLVFLNCSPWNSLSRPNDLIIPVHSIWRWEWTDSILWWIYRRFALLSWRRSNSDRVRWLTDNCVANENGRFHPHKVRGLSPNASSGPLVKRRPGDETFWMYHMYRPFKKLCLPGYLQKVAIWRIDTHTEAFFRLPYFSTDFKADIIKVTS
jgi:hypothetical protein